MPPYRRNPSVRPVRIAVMTVSDTRTPADDKSGNILADMLTDDGHVLAARAIVPGRQGPDR